MHKYMHMHMHMYMGMGMGMCVHDCACACVTGRRDVARGRGTRRGHATDTAGPRAVEYTKIRRPVPAPTAVSEHRPRPAQAAAHPR
eukprot:3093624-Prymnesium_polylepis.1